ncbi:MAG: DUF1822 family protein [Hormoscilla sp. GM102CHS1]|nr:DUF1822 family protein [Hormoscilla sp. GM102CHS1]
MIAGTRRYVADLVVKGRGKLECRPVWPGATVCQLPLEARDDLLGYVVVQVDERAREATLLGYRSTAADGEIDLGKLRSIASPNPWLFL